MQGTANATPLLVIPAKAGIQLLIFKEKTGGWIPAFAGMTTQGLTYCTCRDRP